VSTIIFKKEVAVSLLVYDQKCTRKSLVGGLRRIVIVCTFSIQSMFCLEACPHKKLFKNWLSEIEFGLNYCVKVQLAALFE